MLHIKNWKRRFKKTWLGKFLRHVRYNLWQQEKTERRLLREDPVVYWTLHDRNQMPMD